MGYISIAAALSGQGCVKSGLGVTCAKGVCVWWFDVWGQYMSVL